METMVPVLAVAAAALVMACGVWVAVVLVATMARPKRPSEPASQGRVAQRPNP